MEKVEEDKIAFSRQVLAVSTIMVEGVPGAYADRFVKNCEPWNTPKEWFLSRKRPKEGERVG